MIIIGVLKSLTSQLFLSKNHRENFYLNGKKKQAIDSVWMLVRVESGSNRTVRSLKDLAHWKANEWKNWLYVWIVILKPYLPERILLHLSKFTFGCMLLMQRRVEVLFVCGAFISVLSLINTCVDFCRPEKYITPMICSLLFVQTMRKYLE